MITDIRTRHRIYQTAFWLVVVAVLGFGIHNASTNLVQQGVASGFGFLEQSTGFDIASSLISYDASSSYWRLFCAALLNTLLVSVLGIIFATVIGFIVGIMRLSGHPIASSIAAAYVETLRNIPLLLQVFFWYFAVLQPLPSPRASLDWLNTVFINNRGLHLPSPLIEGRQEWLVAAIVLSAALLWYWRRAAKTHRIKTGEAHSYTWWLVRILPTLLLTYAVYLYSATELALNLEWSVPVLTGFNFEGGWVVTPEFFALLLALSTYTGAYIAENVRAGIMSVDDGQIEAARALGLRPWQVMRLVVIPNALRVIIPPLTNQYLTLTKNSSLAAAIAYPDIVLVFAGTALNQTGQAIEILLMVMLVYLLLSLLIALVMNYYNRRVTLEER